MTEPSPDAREIVATSCRILANEGLVTATLGHVSARTDRGMLVRTRGPEDIGLQFTRPEDVKLTSLDGELLEPTEHKVPAEHPIHGVTLARRPEVNAVVHAHPPAVVACTIAGLELEAIIGAYDIPAARMAHDGLPTYPRPVLIRTPAVAEEMLAAMGERPACLLYGHGLVTVGATVQQAVTRAIAINDLAKLTLLVASAGRSAPPIAEADYLELPDLGSALNEESVWRHYAARL